VLNDYRGAVMRRETQKKIGEYEKENLSEKIKKEGRQSKIRPVGGYELRCGGCGQG